MKKLLFIFALFVSVFANAQSFSRDSVRLQLTATANGLSFYNLGNSITYGLNATDIVHLSYVGLMSSYYGLPNTNYALSGSGMWYSAEQGLQNIFPGNLAIGTIMAGFNDIRRNGGAQKCTRKICNGYNAVAANQFLKVWYEGGSSSVTRYGAGWSASYSSNTVGGKSHAGSSTTFGAYTGNINDSLTYVFTDSTVVVGLIGGDGVTNVYSNFNVYIDNVLQGSYSENNMTDGVSDGVNANTFGQMALWYTGLTNATHTLKLVNTSATGTAFFVVDYVGNMIAKANAIPLLIFEIPLMDATGYATSPSSANATIATAMNASIDSTVALFPNWWPVYVAKTNSFYTATVGSGDLSSSDHIHPTNQGHLHISQAGEAVLPFPPPPTPGVVVYQSNDFWGGTGTGKVKLSRQLLAAPGITGNVPYNFGNVFTANPEFNYIPATQYLGVGIVTPLSALDVRGLTPTFRLEDSTGTTIGAISNYQSFLIMSVNRDGASGFIKNSGLATADIEEQALNGGSTIQFRLGTTNNLAGTIRGGMFGNGNFVWGSNVTDIGNAPMQFNTAGVQAAFNYDGTHSTLVQTNGAGLFQINPSGITTVLKAPTAAGATLNLAPSVAVDPTTPNSGDLWWNGTNLYFKPSGTKVDLLAGGGATTIYNGDGTLAANRTVSAGGFNLSLGATGSKLTALTVNSSAGISLQGQIQYGIYQPGDANITVPNNVSVVELPIISANRTITMPTMAVGSVITFYNTNTSNANQWSFTGVTVVDANGFNNVTTLRSGRSYDVLYDGTIYILKENGTGVNMQTGFTQTATVTVANSSAATSLIGAGVGSMTIPANFLYPGRTIRLKIAGVYGLVTATPGNLTVNLKIGSTVIATGIISNFITTAPTNQGFAITATVTCRVAGASGTVMTDGMMTYENNATSLSPRNDIDLNNAGATTTVNTTISNTIDCTVQWATANAANTISATIVSMDY